MITTHRTSRRRAAIVASRTGAALAAATGLTLLGTAVPASAHVRVHADATTTGSFSALTFRVPNESDRASTTKISIQLPQQTPFLYVSTKPVPGWRVTSDTAALPKPVDADGTTITKAVRTITWTADSRDAAIAPGEYQEFSASVGPLPAAGTLQLPATQTYSDGQVVRWDETTTAGGAEPEHPAPELVITSATAGPATPASTPTSASPAPAESAPARGGGDPLARALGGLGLGLGVIGLGLGVLGLRRRAAS